MPINEGEVFECTYDPETAKVSRVAEDGEVSYGWVDGSWIVSLVGACPECHGNPTTTCETCGGGGFIMKHSRVT